jgi:hypothetical protein
LGHEIGRNVEEIEMNQKSIEANDHRLLVLLEEPETSLEKLMVKLSLWQ